MSPGSSDDDTSTGARSFGRSEAELSSWQRASPASVLGSGRRDRRFIRPPRRGFPPANLFSHRLPNLTVVSGFWEQDGSDHERTGAPRRGDRSRWALPGQPRHRLSVTRYRAPCVCCRHRRRSSNRFELCGATPQTAVIFVVTRRYSSGLLNFAAHSPEDSQRDRKCRSARLERTVLKGLFQYRIRRFSFTFRSRSVTATVIASAAWIGRCASSAWPPSLPGGAGHECGTTWRRPRYTWRAGPDCPGPGRSAWWFSDRRARPLLGRRAAGPRHPTRR